MVNSIREVWVNMARRAGAKTVQNPLYSIQMYKQLFIRSTYLVQCIKNKTAFDIMTLEGHRGRVMAIKYHGDWVATGKMRSIQQKGCIKNFSILTSQMSMLRF